MSPLLDDPLLERFFGLQGLPQIQPEPREGAGSGVIVDAANGYVIANHHVLAAAEKVTAVLTDGRPAARTRLVAFTHLTNTVGDLFPAAELCRIARERGVLTLVDGAQSLGLVDVNLRTMDPDFYSGSAHKWPCGPKEAGVLFVNRRSASRLWPSVYSAYPGAVGISKSFEPSRPGTV